MKIYGGVFFVSNNVHFLLLSFFLYKGKEIQEILVLFHILESYTIYIKLNDNDRALE